MTEQVIVMYITSHMFRTVKMYQCRAADLSTDSMQNIHILIYQFVSSTTLIFHDSNQITEQNRKNKENLKTTKTINYRN